MVGCTGRLRYSLLQAESPQQAKGELISNLLKIGEGEGMRGDSVSSLSLIAPGRRRHFAYIQCRFSI